nr:hypothetical protein [Tanacetum cinerariifolium]
MMDAPLSLDHVFDFLADEPQPEPELIEEEDDWLMASVTPSRATMFPHRTYEVGGPSTAAPEVPYLVGRPLLVVACRVALHHQEIGGLCVQTKNLEQGYGTLVRKIEDHELTMDTVVEIETQVSKMQDKEVRAENQQLRARLNATEGDEGLLVSYVLWMEEHITITYEVGGPSTAAPEVPYLVGRPLLVVACRVALHHQEIGGLCVQTKNLEQGYGTLVRKIEDVSNAQVNDDIAMGDL